MDDRLPTALLVSAQIRLAAMEGVPVVVIQKGDPERGTILLKINQLDGVFRLLMQIRLNGKPAWMNAADKQHLTESEAERYTQQQILMDPDLWALEIEDRKGRHWFEGPVMDL